MTEIKIKGGVLIIDKEDAPRVSQVRWHLRKTPNGKPKSIAGKTNTGDVVSLGRFIMDVPSHSDNDVEVDHINHNIFDNRKSNLRICTHAENMYNRRRMSNNKSGFKGVYFCKYAKKYRASLRAQGKKYHGGYYLSAKAAAKAYNNLARQHHGKYAKLNII